MTWDERETLLKTPSWQWGTSEGAELHTLILGLQSTFREKLEWLEEAETLSLRFRASQDAARRKLPPQPEPPANAPKPPAAP